jgi:hypothetical protein
MFYMEQGIFSESKKWCRLVGEALKGRLKL